MFDSCSFHDSLFQRSSVNSFRLFFFNNNDSKHSAETATLKQLPALLQKLKEFARLSKDVPFFDNVHNIARCFFLFSIVNRHFSMDVSKTLSISHNSILNLSFCVQIFNEIIS